jgi:G3E family GTPase
MPGYRKDAAVVVADAETVRARAEHEATRHQIVAQLRAADLLVLNKTDLVDAASLDETWAWLRGLVGRSTAVVETAFGAVPADVVLGAAPAADRARDGHDHAHPSFETWSWSGAAPITTARGARRRPRRSSSSSACRGP